MSQVSTSIDANYVANKIKEWASKVNKTPEELMAQYQEILAGTTGKTDSAKYKKALNKMLSSFDTNMRSSAIVYDVIILGASRPEDQVFNLRRKMLKKYKESPAECIADGSVILDGNSPVLMDTRKTWNNGKENFGFGKPIPEHSWLTTVFAVAKKPGEDQKWIPATIYLREEQALWKIPIFKELEVRLGGKYSTEQSRYLLNATKKATSFDQIKRDVPMSEISQLVDVVYANKFVLPAKLHEDFEATKEDYNRFIVTEATLSRFYQNPKEDGISSIVLVDESLEFGETITGFIEPSIKSCLDNLKDDDVVTVIGKTMMMDEKDENKQPTGEQVLGMNVYSVFTRPE